MENSQESLLSVDKYHVNRLGPRREPQERLSGAQVRHLEGGGIQLERKPSGVILVAGGGRQAA